MARRSRRFASRTSTGLNVWPGYVDALSTLVMVVVFVLLVFVVGQQFLASVVTQREHTLDALRQNINQLTHMLSTRDETIQNLRDSQTKSQNLEAEQLTQINTLSARIAELNTQLASISQALDLEKQAENAKDAQIADLGQKLNIALADKINLLKRYRSEFFERLSAVLKGHKGVEVVGDRFVFQSEILFPPGSASLSPEGEKQIRTLARTLKQVAATIPATVPWLLRVDGHADRQPIHTRFPSNWELSSARAITVVKMLMAEGIDPRHLAATGFSVYQPLERGNTPAAYARNRRIEFRLTDR